MKRGFTLIELLIVAVIIAILTGFVLVNYPNFNRTFALQRSASKLAQDIRRAQEKAVAMKEVGGVLPDGYGVYLDENSPNSYKLFADQNNDHLYDAVDDATGTETINLESKVQISSLSPASPLHIVFEPPDPTIWINNSSSSESSSTIILQLETDDSKRKTIYVNSSGLITIE